MHLSFGAERVDWWKTSGEEEGMRPNDEDLKAQMMAAAEGVIEKLLAGTKEKEELSLSDIELRGPKTSSA